MKPPQPALPHRPTVPRPRRPGERDGEKPTVPPWLFPPPSSTPSSSSDNGSTGKSPNLGGPRSPPPGGGGGWRGGTRPSSPFSPALGFGAAPLAKGVPGKEPGLGPPAFAAPPKAVIPPIQSGCWLRPPPRTRLCRRASAGKRLAGGVVSKGKTPPKCIRPSLWPAVNPGKPPPFTPPPPKSWVTALCVGEQLLR